jgi:hypothetical protein
MVNLSLDRSVRLAEGVVFRELDGETVILNLETGMYFGLDPVGTRIWQLCQQQGVLRSVFQSMQSEYDASAEELEADLLGLVEQLSAKGLVTLG